MSPFERNWTTGVLVTAEAASGIGFPTEIEFELPEGEADETPSGSTDEPAVD